MSDEPDEPGDTTPHEPSRQKQPMASDHGKLVASWFAMIGIGFEFLAAIVVMGAVGWWLDRKLGTSPWLLLAGGAVGFAAGLTLMIRAASGAFKD
jgi:F0F1-type ATP synthase assembly protein I